MSALALKIQRARNAREVDACLAELAALVELAGQRIQELQAEDEELGQRITEAMQSEFNDLD
jgi:hypothetical protein